MEGKAERLVMSHIAVTLICFQKGREHKEKLAVAGGGKGSPPRPSVLNV
jgi:hypothetical protein